MKTQHTFLLTSFLTTALTLVSTTWADPPPLHHTIRASVSSMEAEGNRSSFNVALDASGRFVAFTSRASNLVESDNNDVTDIFVRDLYTNVTKRVSVSSAGIGGNDISGGPAISADGSYVAFYSAASNLVVGDNNGETDIFVHNLRTGLTQRVSVNSEEKEAIGNDSFGFIPAISADGRFVAFPSNASNLVNGDHNDTSDVFLRDLKTGVTERVSVGDRKREANEKSPEVILSSNARIVAFSSDASNLVEGDNNGVTDVFVRLGRR